MNVALDAPAPCAFTDNLKLSDVVSERAGCALRIIDAPYGAESQTSICAQNGLEARGFKVTRLHTYNTVPVSSVDPVSLELAKRARVVAIASPSAVKCAANGLPPPPRA